MELTGPRLIFWEITQNCNLNCPYCRRITYSGGLSKKESQQIINSITRDYHPLLVFSGGEPLLYPYFFEIATYASVKGLKIALATNGCLINKHIAVKIKSIGFHRVAVSLDGASKEINDSLRGEGTFSKIIIAIQYLKSQGIALQINTTVTKKNLKEITSIYKLCLELGIEALHIFAFVPVGCGISVPKEQRLTPLEYEEFLGEVANLSLESKIEIKVTCAPHYNRILSQIHDKRIPVISKGCLAASGICFISAKGDVYPCGYLTISAGNVLKDTFTPLEISKKQKRGKFLTGFKKIWEESYLFQTLRNPNCLKGRCGVCEYIDLCGGCRARAYAQTDDYLEEEPDCAYQPLTVRS